MATPSSLEEIIDLTNLPIPEIVIRQDSGMVWQAIVNHIKTACLVVLELNRHSNRHPEATKDDYDLAESILMEVYPIVQALAAYHDMVREVTYN